MDIAIATHAVYCQNEFFLHHQIPIQYVMAKAYYAHIPSLQDSQENEYLAFSASIVEAKLSSIR